MSTMTTPKRHDGVHGGPSRPEITQNGLTWVWTHDSAGGGYRIKGAEDLPFQIVFYPHDRKAIFSGWTLLHVGCGTGIEGYHGPDGAMHYAVDLVRSVARRRLDKAQADLRKALDEARACGMEV